MNWLELCSASVTPPTSTARSTTLAVVSPVRPIPKLTVNCAGLPRAAERTGVIWYVAAVAPLGSVSSVIARELFCHARTVPVRDLWMCLAHSEFFHSRFEPLTNRSGIADE